MRIIGYCSHVIDAYGLNDMGYGPLSSVIATRTALAAMFGKPTWGTTLPPVTYSTDNWASIANQTERTDTRPLNALIRGGVPGETGYFDVAEAVDPNQAGDWPVAPNIGATVGTPFYATMDGIHESPVMNELIHTSGVINPGKLTLPSK